MSRKEYENKASVIKNSGRETQKAWCKNELFGGKLLLVK
jgi:hypothetical protein